MRRDQESTRIVIMGAAGRDFHDFNMKFRDDPSSQIVAFTAAQIPNIADRRYPPALAGKLYPDGIPIHPEAELAELIRRERVDQVYFSYSDVPHIDVMHKASIVLAAGASFGMLGPDATMLRASRLIFRSGAKGLAPSRGTRDPNPGGRQSLGAASFRACCMLSSAVLWLCLATGCENPGEPNGTSCDDGIACALAAACDGAGACRG